MENQQLVSPSQHCSSTPVSFGQGFLSKEQWDNTGASPILSWSGSSQYILVLNWNQHWRDSTYVLLLTSLRMRQKSWKGCTKWLPGVYPTPVLSLAEVYICTMGLLLRKCSFNDCTVLYFSEKKWFQEHFEFTTYIYNNVQLQLLSFHFLFF
jgi:hypothetical protein